MKLESLSMQNFRSWQRKTIQLSPQITVISGPNTAGKTNIIEAIYALATGKSFRADSESEVVRWGEEFGRVNGVSAQTKLEIIITRGSVGGRKTQIKKYLVNGIPRRVIDFIGRFHAVLFWPEDLDLVTDSPSLRRRYLDRVLVQTDREYRRNLFSYERGLRQRNKLLDAIAEGSAERGQLLFWNQLLVKTGGFVTDKRTAYIDFINSAAIPNLKYEIMYDKSIISESRLLAYKDAEIGAKATLVGPHRDDFLFYKLGDGQIGPDAGMKLDLSKYGSRGEQRLGVLWLKIAELQFIQSETADQPTLLLDDVFSELDISHRKTILQLITNQQTVITTSEREITDILKHGNVQFDMIEV